MIRRTEWIERIAIAVAIGLAAVGQLGWIRTGSATRNSYEMLRSAQRLGLDELTPLRVVWFLVPVVGLAALMLLASGHRRLGAAAVLAQSIVVGLAGIVAWSSGLAAGPGAPLATMLAIAGLMLGGLLFSPLKSDG